MFKGLQNLTATIINKHTIGIIVFTKTSIFEITKVNKEYLSQE